LIELPPSDRLPLIVRLEVVTLLVTVKLLPTVVSPLVFRVPVITTGRDPVGVSTLS